MAVCTAMTARAAMTDRAVLVLRPEPGNRATCAAARALGLDPVASPLFAYGPLPWDLPADPAVFSGLLAGSMAVFAHGGTGLAPLRALPVHAVGAATADAARAAGFAIASTGAGGLQPITDRLAPGHYLRLAGAARVTLVPPAGVTIADVVVYAAHPVDLPPALADRLRRAPPLVLLHSAEAARHWRAQCIDHNLLLRDFALACLAPRIADAAGAGWRRIGIAGNPDDQALLSLASQMCETL